jgi:DNA-binding MarR family transcriptional regulator
VSTLANAMVSAGMLDRTPGPTDKRTVEFSLTAQGAQFVGQWRTTNSDLLLSAIAALDAQDQRVLAEALPVLERLVAVIDEQAQVPTHTRDAGIAVLR